MITNTEVSHLLMFDRVIEFVRHLITFVLLLWNYRLNRQNEQIMKLNIDLLEALPKDEHIKPRLDVDIDFDEASAAWRKNKIDKGNGEFEYKSKESDSEDNVSVVRCPEAPHRYNTRLAKRIRNQEGQE